MIDNKTFSVLITTYRRFDTLDEVISGWLKQPVEQVWVLDNSGSFRTKLKDERLKIWSLPLNCGTRIDYAIANVTDGDFVVLGDDDAVVEPGFLEDLYRGWEQVGGGIVGVIGRIFTNEEYMKCKWCSALKIDKPIKTGSIGVIYFSPRQHFQFDTRGMDTINDDIYWLMEKCSDVPKHVIPTKKFRNLPTASDKGCLFHAPPILRTIRYDYFRKWYKEKYKPFGRTT